MRKYLTLLLFMSNPNVYVATLAIAIESKCMIIHVCNSLLVRLTDTASSSFAFNIFLSTYAGAL